MGGGCSSSKSTNVTDTRNSTRRGMSILNFSFVLKGVNVSFTFEPPGFVDSFNVFLKYLLPIRQSNFIYTTVRVFCI